MGIEVRLQGESCTASVTRAACARLGSGFTGRRAACSGITWHLSGALSRPFMVMLHSRDHAV